jgi:hypothetical protein
MKILHYEFQHVCHIKPVRQENGELKQYMPQALYKDRQSASLHKYGSGPFCKFTIARQLQTAGVYVLSVESGIYYVGECIDLSSRFNGGYGNISPRNCFRRGQETNCRLNNLIYRTISAGNSISLHFLQTPGRKSIEFELRRHCNPTWNRI